MSFGVKDNVIGFQVPEYYVSLVETLKSQNDLTKVHFSGVFIKTRFFPDHLSYTKGQN